MLLSLALESRELEVSLVVGRDFAAFLVFAAFVLGGPLGLVSVDRNTGWASSLSGLVVVSVCAVCLELRGSATGGVEPERRSSEADLVPSSDPSMDFAASIKARRLFFLGPEMGGDRDSDGDEVEMRVEEDMSVLICSDSFCFFFLVAAELGDNDCDEDDDTADAFLLFFDCALVCVDFAARPDRPAST